MPVFAVTTAKGANWDHARDIRQQPLWEQHAAFADQLADMRPWTLWLDGRSRGQYGK